MLKKTNFAYNYAFLELKTIPLNKQSNCNAINNISRLATPSLNEE